MASKRARSKYIVSGAEEARSSIPTTATNLARLTGCSPASIKHVLEGTPKTRIICEKFVNACVQLGSTVVDESSIKESR